MFKSGPPPFQCTIAADLIWRAVFYYCVQMLYTALCLHERILLNVIENLEANGRKMII